MQLYRDLALLTARPNAAERARAPHALYGVRPAAAPANAAWWRAAALAAMTAAREAGKQPILCGGSGLYLQALVAGIAEIPPIPLDARAKARALLAELGPAGLHARLATLDPDTAMKLRPSDPQRLARAMEVWLGTGRGLSSWQQAPPVPPAGWRFAAILLAPPRAALRDAIAARFGAMLAAGAVAEVEALLAQDLDPALPALRAHGVPELAAHLRGEISLEEAATRACAATLRYTKRQATWFRHHPLAPETYIINTRISSNEQFSERCMADLLNFIRAPGLTPGRPPA